MSEYTPSTGDVRIAWSDTRASSIQEVPLAEAEFNRWLVSIQDESFREGLAHAAWLCENYVGHPYNAAAELGSRLHELLEFYAAEKTG